jgi:hypothetical protein
VPAPPPSNPIDLSAAPLLLGVDGDVRLVDGIEVEADALAAGIHAAGGHQPVGVLLGGPALVGTAAAAGAGLVHLAHGAGASEAVRSAARAGVVVVLAGEPEPALLVGLDLLDHGALRGRVVVEVPVTVESCPVDDALVRHAEGGGLVVGAALQPAYGLPAEVAGWEIGVLAQVLTAGVRTVRGVPAARFRRVRAVVDAVAGGRSDHHPYRTLLEQASGRLR